MATLAVGIRKADSYSMVAGSHSVADPNQVVALGMGRMVPRDTGRKAQEVARRMLDTLVDHVAEANAVGSLEVVLCTDIGCHKTTACYCRLDPRNRPYHSATPCDLGRRQSRHHAFGLLASVSPLASLLPNRPLTLTGLQAQDPEAFPSTPLVDERICKRLHVCTCRNLQTGTSLS